MSPSNLSASDDGEEVALASRPLTHIQFWPQANDPGDRNDQENLDIVSSDAANPQKPDPEDTAAAKLSRKRRRNRNQD